jgi:hypothetical protein
MKTRGMVIKNPKSDPKVVKKWSKSGQKVSKNTQKRPFFWCSRALNAFFRVFEKKSRCVVGVYISIAIRVWVLVIFGHFSATPIEFWSFFKARESFLRSIRKALFEIPGDFGVFFGQFWSFLVTFGHFWSLFRVFFFPIRPESDF